MVLPTVISVVVGLFFFSVYVECGPSCYECQRIPFPRDCDRIRRCGDHERCFTRQYISTSGVIWYDAGCFPMERCLVKRSVDSEGFLNVSYSDGAIQDDSDVITCEQCCDGEFCNSKGCGSQPLPPRSTRGPVCFSCHQQPTHDTCDVITRCGPREQCYLLPTPHGTVDRIYSTGCMTDAQCDTLQAITLVGRRRQQPSCSGCCNRDYCNQNCTTLLSSTNNPTVSTVSTTLSSTTSSSTSSSTSTTTISTTIVSSTSLSTTKSPSPARLDKGTCEAKGYQFYATYNLCYKIYHIKKTWQSARISCIKEGGDLIVFDNQAEKDYFDRLARGIYASIDQYHRRFWVGASDLATEQHWIWVDNTTVDRAFFHPNEPNNAYQGEDCGAMTYFYTDNHTWINDDGCDVLSDYACQLKNPSVGPVTVSTHSCKNQDFTTVPSLKLCYKIYKNQLMTWQEAKEFCANQSASLLMLKTSAVESYFVQQHFYDTSNNHRYWLGGNDFSKRHKFTWLDGQPLSSALVWNRGEPNDFYQNERCLDFTYAFGSLALNDDDCNKKLYFICEEILS